MCLKIILCATNFKAQKQKNVMLQIFMSGMRSKTTIDITHSIFYKTFGT